MKSNSAMATCGICSGFVPVLGIACVIVSVAAAKPPGPVDVSRFLRASGETDDGLSLEEELESRRRADATVIARAVAGGGDNCNTAPVTFLPVGLAGSPNSIVLTGDSSAATSPDCFSSTIISWWEAFEIDKCANVTIDFCGTSPTISPNFGAITSACATDGSSCSPTINSDSFTRALCGAEQNATLTFNALPPGKYYHPIISDAAFLGHAPGLYTMTVTAEECSGSCTGCLGACCDFGTETCTENVTQDQCVAVQETWSARTKCCAVECRDPAGPQFDALGVELLSQVPLATFGAQSANDIWGYVSPTGRKYAIVGLSNSTGFVDITDPRSPSLVATIADDLSIWSDMATFKTFAYNVNEEQFGAGIQIIDLTNIDSGTVTLLGSAAGGVQHAHNIYVNPVSGFAYACGTNNAQGIIAFDLSNPANPVAAGTWNDNVVHDVYARSFDQCPWSGRAGQPCELAYLFVGSAGLKIVDVTNKASMTTISTLTYPTLSFCHQGWLSDDGRFLFFNDELDENSGLVSQTRTYVADVQNPAAPTLVATFDHPGCWIDHNLIPQGDRLYQAHYSAGLRVLNVQNPLVPAEVAYFDTHPEDNVTDFVGAWGVYTGLPSRVVLISDIERGLFVLCDQPDLPVPSLTVARNPGVAREPLTFDGSSSTTCDTLRAIVTYQWDFDFDGTTFDVDATGAGPVHVYASSGVFSVALRVTDDLGAQAVSTFDITITPPVPAVSQWGLMVMGLLTLLAGTLVLYRKNGVAPRCS